MHLPTMTTTQINQCITQTTVCTYTTCYGNLIDFEILGSAFEFVDEDVDDRFLLGCTKVGFVFLYEVLVLFEVVAEEIQERCFEA